MTSALAALDESSAKSMWQQAQDLLPIDMPTLPLLHAKLPGAARSYVHGVIASGSMVEILRTVWLDR
jgi:ABC-type transport system substrate-binding protein